MPARSLILAMALLAAPTLAQQLDPAAIASATARAKAFPSPMTAVESVDAYTPSEIVRGRPRPLPHPRITGIAPDALTSAQAYADTQQSFALVVLRDGMVVYEHYAPGFSAASRFSPASMHKTVMALAFGTANIPLDAPVARWLTEWQGDPRGAITVGQLLSMSSGLEVPPFTPDPSGISGQMMFGPDIVKAALRHTLAAPPGSQFAYANGNSQLAGIILERATKARYADYLSRHIWRPIGASDATVFLDHAGGTPHFFCCLQATALDYARVGQLILDEGRAAGRQIVSAAWVKAMGTASATNPNYGLQLWRGSPYVAERRYNKGSLLVAKAAKPYLRDDVLFMDGAVGQRVYVISSEHMVIVRIGKSSLSWDDSELPNRILAGLPIR